jgi:hypothetical protein
MPAGRQGLLSGDFYFTHGPVILGFAVIPVISASLPFR